MINIKRNLRINWWLWACLSVPAISYLLFHKEQDKAGDLSSAWSEVVHYATRSDLHLYYAWEILVLRGLLPLVIGWIVQYLLMMAWNYWQRNSGKGLKP